MYAARLLTRPAAAWLEVPGTAPEQRAQLISELTGYRTKDDLVDRQLTRSAVWALLFAFAVLPLIAVGVVLELTVGGDQIPWGVLFFLFWMAVLTAAKCGLAWLLPADRWRPDSPLARGLLLAQTLDVVLALTIAAASVVLTG